jgi:hypothetical protein
MLSSRVWVSGVELASLTLTVKFAVPVDDGVPEIAPVDELSDTFVGSAPAGMLQV